MQKIVITNNKGGVGKTTTSINLAGAFRRMGLRVLLVDSDPQANASTAYSAVIDDTNTIYDLLLRECTAAEAVQTTAMGDIIPAEFALNEIRDRLKNMPGSELRLRKALRSLDDRYDICLIDTPPEIDIYMNNGMCAADYCIVPIIEDDFSAQGIVNIFNHIRLVIDEVNEDLKILGLLHNKADARTKVDRIMREHLDDLRAQGYPVLPDVIHVDQAVTNSRIEGRELYDYSDSRAAVDYMLLAEYIVDMIKEDNLNG